MDHLKANARALTSYASLLVGDDIPADLVRSQLQSYSFLSQTRVLLLDSKGVVLGDSGDPREVREQATISLGLEVGGLSQTFTQTVDSAGREKRYSTSITMEDTAAGADDGEKIHIAKEVVVSRGDSERVERLPESDVGLAGQGGLARPMPDSSAQLGLGFATEGPLGTHRSEQVLRQPLYDLVGDLRGYVELSEGPAIGREILNTVAWAWAISSSVAVLLAAAVGWLISRRLSSPLTALTRATASMAAGDLSIRANVARKDELGQLAGSFNEMARRVEDTVLALRRFVADAAHQLNTPVTALRTDLELMAGVDVATRREALVARARTQVDRMEALCSGRLDLSRIETGVARDARIGLASLLRETSELYASRAEQTDISFSLDISETAAAIRGNEAQLRQALGNLLDNAIKFTPEGGDIGVALSRRDGWATLHVEDTGIGIPDDDLPHLFGRFHRGRNATAYPGSGLGLAIVEAIVDGHGGSVAAENTSRGARFSLRLPLAERCASSSSR